MSSNIVEIRLNHQLTPETVELLNRLIDNAKGAKKSMISSVEAATLVTMVQNLMSDLDELNSVFQELIEEGILRKIGDPEAPSILDDIPKVHH